MQPGDRHVQCEKIPTILLVDDDELVRQAFGMFFDALGWKHELVADGIRGLERARSNAFDIIITDLMMPQMDGADFLRQVRKDNPRQTVIVVTGGAASEHEAHLLGLGAAQILQKPVDLETLQNVVASLMSQPTAEPVPSLEQFAIAEDSHYRLKTLALRSGYPELPLLKRLRNAGTISAQQYLQLTLVFQEALANSVEHGNLELLSSWREEYDKDGVDRYSRVKKERLADDRYAERWIEVESTFHDQILTIKITDQGPGFEVTPATTRLEKGQPAMHGRGISLIRSNVDELAYAHGGRELTVRKKIVGEPHGS